MSEHRQECVRCCCPKKVSDVHWPGWDERNTGRSEGNSPAMNTKNVEAAKRRAMGLWSLSPLNTDTPSYHGPEHWQQVLKNAQRLCLHTAGADREVCEMFAWLHDSCRENEHGDGGHGARAASLVQDMRNVGEIVLDEYRFTSLFDSILYHDSGLVALQGEAHRATKGVCWDADRLDLPRVGITPDPKLMSTPIGAEIATKMQEDEHREYSHSLQ